MIGEVRALKAMTGLRGKPRGDLEALAQTVSALSQLALRPELGVAEAEVNPLLVMEEGKGVMAVDALIMQV
jgi:succinyl-CoA synthetase beta subunit